MSNQEDRLLALSWLNEIQARDEAADVESADGFAIVVTTVEGGRTMTWVHGPVSNYIEALRLAELHEDQLNAGIVPGEVPFTAKVYPMNKPEGWE